MSIMLSIITLMIAIFCDDHGEFKPYFETVDGQLYYVEAKTRYRITEHFAETGKSLTELLVQLIQYEMNEREKEAETDEKI